MNSKFNIHNSALVLLLAVAFTGCKTYDVMHYKGPELDKEKNLDKYTVYLHAKEHVFAVSKPALDKTAFTGGLSLVSDPKLVEEINNPATRKQLKKHAKDINIYTKKELADSLATINLPKGDITEYSRVIVHAGVNVGNIVGDVLGTAAAAAVLGAFIYWVSLSPW